MALDDGPSAVIAGHSASSDALCPGMTKKSAPAEAGATWQVVVRASVAKTRGVGHLFPMGQAFRDDLGRLQRRLAQGRILDDLALHARGLALQRVAQRLQLSDEFVDFLHRSPCHSLQQLVDVVGNQLAVALRLAPNAHNVAAHEFADFPFHFRLRRGLDFGGLTRLQKAHGWYPRSAPVRAELHPANSRMRM